MFFQRWQSLVPLTCSFLAATTVAQTGRTMKLTAPVVLGQTASMVIQHPPSLAGNLFAMAMCSPSYPGALPVSIPGVVTGVLRLDPLAFSVVTVGILDASGQSPALSFAVPNDPLLVGASFDVQGLDIDGSGLITLTDNDLEIEVSAPPPASLNMVPIAAGTFQMGSLVGHPTEMPAHQVTLTAPFWMCKYEVTQAHYQDLMLANPSYFQGLDLPVEQVSWFDAVAFCNVLSVGEAAAGRLPSGYEYRLPTEAEWEYCCRAGTTTAWSTGGEPFCADANLNYLCVGQTSSVGSYSANPWGLYDMHGNVFEWCLDKWDGSANYPAGPVSDPLVTTGPNQVIRSGAWLYDSYTCRSARRVPFNPASAHRTTGFRVVCAPVLP